MPPVSHGRVRRGVRSWLRNWFMMPVTIASLVATFAALGVASGVENTKVAGEVFMTIGGVLAVVLLIDLAMTVYEEWIAWSWIFERLRAWRRYEAGTRRPEKFAATMFYPIHLVDEYIGLALMFALLSMGPWVIDQTGDKSRFYAGFDIVTDRNLWTTWIKFVATSFLVGTGTGFASFVPVHWATFLISLFNGAVLFMYVTVVMNIMLGWFFEKDHDEQFDTHQHGVLYEQERQQQQQQQQMYQQQQQQQAQRSYQHSTQQQQQRSAHPASVVLQFSSVNDDDDDVLAPPAWTTFSADLTHLA